MEKIVGAVLVFLVTLVLILSGLLWYHIKKVEPPIEIVKIETVTVVRVDTFYVERVRHIPLHIPGPITEVPLPSGEVERTYQTQIEDTLLTGTITSVVHGTLVKQDFDYTISIPTIRETITETTTITKVLPPKRILAVGLEVPVAPFYTSVSPVVRYQSRRGTGVHYRYQPETQVTPAGHHIGITLPIKF
jgi:hypothetical protein